MSVKICRDEAGHTHLIPVSTKECEEQVGHEAAMGNDQHGYPRSKSSLTNLSAATSLSLAAVFGGAGRAVPAV